MSEISPQAVRSVYERITSELGKVMVGQEQIISLLLVSLFSRGHCLLVGVPGLAKTLLVRSLAENTASRIQANPVHPRSDAERYSRIGTPAGT
jgi:MoxR-like ATPase